MEEYRIVITDETAESASPIAGTQADGSAKPKETDKDSAVKNAAKGYVAGKKFIAPFIDQVISYQISTVALRTGNTDRQQRFQYTYNIGKRAFSAVESTVVGGLASGSWIGAVVGLALNLTSTAISLAQQVERFNLQRNIENNAIGLMNIRAGGGIASNGSR